MRGKIPCGVPSLTASALTSLGSVENVERVSAGWLDAGFVQSDVAYWAYTGEGLFKDRKPHPKIRAVASLYPESMHRIFRFSLTLLLIIAPPCSGIQSKGRYASLVQESPNGLPIDETGSSGIASMILGCRPAFRPF